MASSATSKTGVSSANATGRTISGTTGDDRLNGTQDDDTIYGLGGKDLIWSHGGHDTIDGGAGDDDLRGGDGNDTLIGGIGNDTLWGQAGNDTLRGGNDNDLFYGTTGDGSDRIFGDSGFDTVSYQFATSAVVIDADGGRGYGAAAGDTYTGVEKFVGTNYGDYMVAYDDDAARLSTGSTLDGGKGVDILYGRSDNDTLLGGEGDDELNGFGGNDRLEGGKGFDHLTGGSGVDTFVFSKGSGKDYVADFARGTDKIDLTGYDFGSDNPLGYDGILATGTHITRADHLGRFDKLFYNTAEHVLYEIDQSGSGPTKMTAIAQFSDHTYLRTGDLLL